MLRRLLRWLRDLPLILGRPADAAADVWADRLTDDRVTYRDETAPWRRCPYCRGSFRGPGPYCSRRCDRLDQIETFGGPSDHGQ